MSVTGRPRGPRDPMSIHATPQRPEAAAGASDLQGYAALFWRRKWIIIPFVVLMPLLAYAHALTQTKIYEGSAQVLLSRQSQSLAGLNDPLVLQPERVIRTQRDIARLPVIAARVTSAAGLNRDALTFLGQSSVDSNDQIDLLTFRVRDRDPRLAAVLGNLYAQKYIEYRRQIDTTVLDEAARAVRKQLRELRAQGLSVSSVLYGSLAEKLQQLESAKTLQKSNAVLVRRADDAGQVEPRPQRTALLALALGIVLGLGLALVVDTLDTRMRAPGHLADELGLVLLGSLPEPARSLSKDNSLVMLNDPNSQDAELVRIVRTNLEVTALSAGCKSLMVASALQAEGKSTTASNLAIAIARTGKHVILVDMDLRRPTLHKFFDLRRRPGITDVVFGRATVDEAVTRMSFGDAFGPVSQESTVALFDRPGPRRDEGRPTGTLEVIGAGSTPPNPGDFLVTRELDKTLQELEDRADILIVDGPPLLLAGDALTLSSKVEALLLVTRMNAFKQGQVRDLERVLAASPAMKVGVVATGHTAIPRRAYYGTVPTHDERPAPTPPRPRYAPDPVAPPRASSPELEDDEQPLPRQWA